MQWLHQRWTLLPPLLPPWVNVRTRATVEVEEDEAVKISKVSTWWEEDEGQMLTWHQVLHTIVWVRVCARRGASTKSWQSSLGTKVLTNHSDRLEAFSTGHKWGKRLQQNQVRRSAREESLPSWFMSVDCGCSNALTEIWEELGHWNVSRTHLASHFLQVPTPAVRRQSLQCRCLSQQCRASVCIWLSDGCQDTGCSHLRVFLSIGSTWPLRCLRHATSRSRWVQSKDHLQVLENEVPVRFPEKVFRGLQTSLSKHLWSNWFTLGCQCGTRCCSSMNS